MITFIQMTLAGVDVHAREMCGGFFFRSYREGGRENGNRARTWYIVTNEEKKRPVALAYQSPAGRKLLHYVAKVIIKNKGFLLSHSVHLHDVHFFYIFLIFF